MQAKALVVALAVSLAVNFALIGFLVGERGGPGPSFDPTLGFAGWLRVLPAERREELHPVLREHRREGRVMLRELRSHNRALIEALEGEPFSASALNEALEQLRARQVDARTQSHAAFVDVVATLSLEERRLVAERMKRPHRLRGGPHGRPPPPGD